MIFDINEEETNEFLLIMFKQINKITLYLFEVLLMNPINKKFIEEKEITNRMHYKHYSLYIIFKHKYITMNNI